MDDMVNTNLNAILCSPCWPLPGSLINIQQAPHLSLRQSRLTIK